MIEKLSEAYTLLTNSRGKINSNVDAKLRWLNDDLKKSKTNVESLKRLNKCHSLAEEYHKAEDYMCK